MSGSCRVGLSSINKINMKLFHIFCIMVFFNQLYSQGDFNSFSEALKTPEKVKKLKIVFSNDEAVMIDSRVKLLVNLEELEIVNYKKPKVYLPNELKSLRNLRTLGILGFELVEIPEVIYELDQLENLTLSFFKAESYSPEIRNLKNLKYLRIRSNMLETIPVEVYSLRELEELYIGGDSIKYLPAGISNLDKLKQLRIHTSSIKSLPNELNKLINLEVFDLYCKNNISIPLSEKNESLVDFRWGQCKIIPLNICQLKSLKRLSFDAGEILEIPSCIRNLSSLIELTINYHPIKNIPKELLELKNLKMIDFSSTQISELDEAFFTLPNIGMIDLNYCEKISASTMKRYIDKYDQKLYYDED